MSHQLTRTAITGAWRGSNHNGQDKTDEVLRAPKTNRFDKNVEASSSAVGFSPILEEGKIVGDAGFTTVTRGKRPVSSELPNRKHGKGRAASTYDPRPGPYPARPTTGTRTVYTQARHSPPSAAATNRASVYDSRKETPSLYKQPGPQVNERDQVQRAIESHKTYKISKQMFRPGMLIRAVLHEQDFNGACGASSVSVADKYRSESFYGPVHSKFRKMIVLACYESHYVAIPMFTHNGHGLSRKGNPGEFISVQDHRFRGPFIPLSVHGSLLTQQVNAGIDPYHPLTTAHITYPLSRKYTLPVVQEGCLETNALKHLIKLVEDYAPKDNF